MWYLLYFWTRLDTRVRKTIKRLVLANAAMWSRIVTGGAHIQLADVATFALSSSSFAIWFFSERNIFLFVIVYWPVMHMAGKAGTSWCSIPCEDWHTSLDFITLVACTLYCKLGGGGGGCYLCNSLAKFVHHRFRLCALGVRIWIIIRLTWTSCGNFL